MPKIVLPFLENNGPEDGAPERNTDEFIGTLPDAFRDACEKNRHLREYVYILPVGKIGVPDFTVKLSRAHGAKDPRNIIYQVTDKIFVHVLSNEGADRDWYIPIEPGFGLDMAPVMRQVETRLIDIAGDLEEAQTDEERTEGIKKCLEKICAVGERGVPAGAGGRGNGKEDGRNGNTVHSNGRVHVTPDEFEALNYLVIRDKVGMGILESIIRDTNIEDISCSGVGNVFIEHKVFRALSAAITFVDNDDLDEFVLRLSEQIRKPVTLRNPIVDATLPDGSRINIVFGREISRRGSNFTIRKFADTPLSILELVEFGSISYEMAAYLSLVIEEGMNVFVVGETASGKTTLMNAITTFIPIDRKIVSIEDTPELQVPHANWIREVAKAGGDNREAQVTMFDLLKAALRQRPNVIIIGEIRGEEGNIAFGAMQTGHAVMSTFHAASVEKVIQRITGNPINVPKTHVDNLNVVVVQNAVKLPNGKNGRRACSISEIVGYDPSSESFNYVEVFRWNPATDVFEFVGNRNSYLLEEKIALRRGIPTDRKWEIYALLTRRAKILERLHKEKKVTNFYELLKILAMAQEKRLF